MRPSIKRPSTVILDVSSPTLGNLGDVAMTVAAYTRVRAALPEARIFIITDRADRLSALCPGAIPLSEEARKHWCNESGLFGSATRLLPSVLRTTARRYDLDLRTRMPTFASKLVHLKLRSAGADATQHSLFSRALRSADLYIATGGGYLNQVFAPHARRVVVTALTARAYGARIAFVGQGIGKITDPTLRIFSGRALRAASLVAVREKLKSRTAAAHLGVREENIVFTGDDAISLVTEASRNEPQDLIGLNIRTASYAKLESTAILEVANTIRKLSATLHAPVQPLPIMLESHHSSADDTQAIAQLADLGSFKLRSMVGEPTLNLIMDATATCRVVITGSYHAAVFALAQGRPAICLHGSEYYDDKFNGLRDAFGYGCFVVSTRSASLMNDLEVAVRSAWAIDSLAIDGLRARAVEQRQMADRVYACILGSEGEP